MEGMTGLNPAVAEQNIKNFQESVENVYWKLNDYIGDFSFSLSGVWASPKAVQFKETVKPMFDELFSEMNESCVSIVHGATYAYNTAARAHGESQIQEIAAGFFDATNFANMYEAKDGVVGMNINIVKNDLLPEFKNRMRSCADAIGSINQSIALYDDENGQQRAYSAGIVRFKDKVESIMDSVSAIIENAIETEAEAVFTGAENAATSLNTGTEA